MTTTEFCYWLKGVLENKSETSNQSLDISLIKRRLDSALANVPKSSSESNKSSSSPGKQTLFG
jgi:hypothetical protein